MVVLVTMIFAGNSVILFSINALYKKRPGNKQDLIFEKQETGTGVATISGKRGVLILAVY